MKKFITIVMTLLVSSMVLVSAKPKAQLREALYQTNLHCKNCAAKIQDNVAFEKGVKDLSIEVDAKTVKIVYNPAKTDAKKLEEAIRKLGYTAELIKDKSL